jgi:hypothetical protein
MTTLFLNQIFYPHNKFDSIQCFNPYMLSESIIMKRNHVQNTEIRDVVGSDTSNELVRPETQSFSPRKTDTLFWCAYVLHHGEAEYTMIGHKYKTTEIQEKQVILEFLSKNREILKATFKVYGYKWSNVRFQETQSELMLDKKTSWFAFHAMCMFYKINAVLVQDNVYMEFKTNDTDEFYQFNRTQEGFVSVDMTPISEIQLAAVRNTHVCIDYGQDKMMKGVSSYKIPELEDIARRLCVTVAMEKPKKGDWYNAIMEKMNQTKLMFV